MKLNKQSLLIKWAYLPERCFLEKGEDPKIPANTTLCAIIWRVILVPWFLLSTLPVMALIAVIFCLVYPGVWMDEEFPKTKLALRIRERWLASVIYAAFTDWKNKICTRIEIE